jgi:hypothetical protein
MGKSKDDFEQLVHIAIVTVSAQEGREQLRIHLYAIKSSRTNPVGTRLAQPEGLRTWREGLLELVGLCRRRGRRACRGNGSSAPWT